MTLNQALAVSERQLEEGRRLLDELKARLGELEAAGQDPMKGRELLRLCEEVVGLMTRHHQQILREYRTAKAGPQT